MSRQTVIRAEGLGKKYIIGHQAASRQSTLRDTISHNLANFARTTRDMLSGKPIIAGDEIEEFWALKNLNFEIERGDVVGIIGHNGAGKSTLLKVLSRITEPSEGRVEIRGRVASLLEVGTGFHPELTGRENIFLNGAILGMRRAEVRRKFDEIVAFSGVEKFLDTPVKRYSSGMYVRLAFSVAAHLEPEVLIVDEVLAVGDAVFQSKCLGKMEEVAKGGRTVLFVSHNMAAVERLCPRSIMLKHGSLLGYGVTKDILRDYMTNLNKINDDAFDQHNKGDKSRGFRLMDVEFVGEHSKGPKYLASEKINLRIKYEKYRDFDDFRFVLKVLDDDLRVAFSSSDHNLRSHEMNKSGAYVSSVCIPANLLNARDYTLSLQAGDPTSGTPILEQTVIGKIKIASCGNEGTSHIIGSWQGALCPKLNWEIERLEKEA